MIGTNPLNPQETKYGQVMDQVRYAGADEDQSTYYDKFTKDGKEYYYISDPMKMRADKRGTNVEYHVPNLYLAYQQKYPGVDQYVFPADQFFGPQNFDIGGMSFNTDTWKKDPRVSSSGALFGGNGRGGANTNAIIGGRVQGRGGITGGITYQQLVDAANKASPKGYVFAADPFSYGYGSYKKDTGGTWDSFWSGLGNLLSVAAAPLTAGLSSLAAISKPVAGAIIGAGTGAMKNRSNPLMGAFTGGLGSLMPVGLNQVGVTNPVVQGALTGLTKGLISEKDPLFSALYGAGMGGIGMLNGAGKATPEQYKSLSPDGAQPKLGESKMDFSSLGGSGGLGLNMGGGGGSFDFLNDMDFGSSFDVGGFDFNGGGLGLQAPQMDWDMGQGISMFGGGGGQGLQMPNFDMGQTGYGLSGMDSIMNQGGGGGGTDWRGGLKEISGALASFNKVLPLKDLIGAGMSAYGNNQAMKRYQSMANQAAQRSDPFASQRAQYQTQLSNLMANPNEIMNDPSYQFRMKQGMDAVARMNSARGYNMSGNEMMAMQDYASQFASQELNNRQNLLAQLGGANFGPGYAGMNYLQGMMGSIDPYQQYLASLGILGRIGMDGMMGGQTPPIVGN